MKHLSTLGKTKRVAVKLELTEEYRAKIPFTLGIPLRVCMWYSTPGIKSPPKDIIEEHWKTVFMFDQMHDWSLRNNVLEFYGIERHSPIWLIIHY